MRVKLIPTLFTLPALVALVWLGVWQLQRLEWKQDLLDRLQDRADRTPVAMPDPLPRATAPDMDAWEFRSVRMTGEFLHDREVHLLNRSLNGNPGLHVLTPFRRRDAGPGEPEILLVNRGWVPFEMKDQAARADGLPTGEQTVQGLMRFPRDTTALQRVFLPPNEPHNNMWYSMNMAAMATRIGADLPDFYIVDGNDRGPWRYPVGRQWRLDIRNDHLHYALTWFALAIALAVIYVLYHRRTP